MATKEPGYLIVVQKVTSLSGESIQVSINLPRESTEADFTAEINKICGALDARLVQQNEKVLALTEATAKAFESIEKDAVQ